MGKRTKGKSPVGVVARLVSLLTPLEATDRVKAIQATLTLLPEDGGSGQVDFGAVLAHGAAVPGVGAGSGGSVPQNEQTYFGAKKPRTKVEELAVAARYRELKHKAESSTKAELQAVFREARYNFDAGNYRRDLENARKGTLFTRGTGRDAATLTAYGQQYVNALPDRDALKNIGSPKGQRRRRGRRRKKK